MPSAIAPITGRFKSRVIRDLFISVPAGTAFGAWYWYGYHVPAIQKYKAYDAQVAADVKEIHDAFNASK
ncbi:hypothetical protein DFJ73DRAFT_629429 [Zopfochytrium polystomum]|nr:hypothetical protein DFJ73DRAFT_629429 [Zopfochytrium polystomum]